MDNSGAENHTTIFTIAESPIDEKVIWVGTDDGNVQVTQDGEKHGPIHRKIFKDCLPILGCIILKPVCLTKERLMLFLTDIR